jgi:hypothetical protein
MFVSNGTLQGTLTELLLRIIIIIIIIIITFRKAIPVIHSLIFTTVFCAW